MKCPYCGDHTKDDWRELVVSCPLPDALAQVIQQGADPDTWSENAFATTLLSAPDNHNVKLDWMTCANNDCKQVVIRMHETYMKNLGVAGAAAGGPVWHTVTDSHFIRPRFSSGRQVPIGVPEPYKSDYAEASAILDLSPRMSAVMSRRVLADLLEKYAGCKQYGLADKIDAFIKEKSHPSGIRENLHHWREVADFGAHTQTDDQAEILNIGREEAEWTLDLLDRLFDYFIIGPARDEQMRKAMDARISAAGRRPLNPEAESDQVSPTKG